MRHTDATELRGLAARAVRRSLPVLIVIGGAAAPLAIPAAGARPVLAGVALVSPLPTPSLPTVSPPDLPKVTPLPTALPSILPTPLPSPSLPIQITPSPSVPPILPTPSPTAGAQAPGGSGGGTGTADSGGGGTGPGQDPGRGWQIPLTGIVIRSPIDAALLAAVAVLPLLFAVWMLLFGRTWTEAQRSRDAQIRLALAADLGLSPRELASVTTRGLFKLREEAAFDETTGVLRRAAGVASVEREISRARRQKSALAVAFLDLDGLKETNDRFGHKAGDELIRGLARILQGGLRGQDVVFRYGGDEFVCVLPDTVADAARAKMSWVQGEAEKQGIHISIGVAELQRSDDVVSILGRADTEMYATKARHHKVRDIRLGVAGGARSETA